MCPRERETEKERKREITQRQTERKIEGDDASHPNLSLSRVTGSAPLPFP